MFASFVSLLVGWIVLSTFLVTVILINSARVSRIDSPDIGSGQPMGELRKKKFELATLIKKLIR
jgi:hypothetical protein